MNIPGPKEAAKLEPPLTWPVVGSNVMTGLVLLCCPSFEISTAMRGFSVPAGNVYLEEKFGQRNFYRNQMTDLCKAARRVDVSSTRIELVCDLN